MQKSIRCWLWLVLTAITPPLLAAEESRDFIDIGVVPYQSTRVLIAQYEPVRLYLEQTLGRQVKIYTASSFKQFLLNAQNGEYDLVISPAHFARILQKENHFRPLVRYAKGGRGWIMAPLGSGLKTAAGLKGKTLAVPFKLSLASIVCMTSLKEQGLKSDTDFSILEVPSFESAILALQKGEADAAVSAPGAMKQLSQTLQDSVQVIMDTGEYVNLIFLSHPRLPNSLADQLDATLMKFGNETAAGRQFMQNTGFESMLDVTKSDMEALDRYNAETRRLLEEK